MLSFVGHREGPTRLFDSLYDPLYIVSGPKDFLRANKFILKAVLPVHVDALLSNVLKSTENDLLSKKSPTLLPHFHRDIGETDRKCKFVNGKDICGHYLPLLLNEAPHLRKSLNLRYDLKLFEKKKEDPTKTISCQTAYRDSYAQTYPIQPEAIIRPGCSSGTDGPEILLADKIFKGQKGPPGEYEARIMERVKIRRQWEKSLPTLLNPKEIEKRQAILEAFEWEEWIKREDYIVEIQNMRLHLVEKLLEKRHRTMNEKAELRMKSRMKHINRNREIKQEKINRNYLRTIRKINAKAQNSILYKTPDIITQFTDLTSERYLPRHRFGIHPGRRTFVGFRKDFSDRMESIDRELGEIDLSFLKCTIRRYEEFSQPKRPVNVYAKCLLSNKNLQTMYESLKQLRLQLSDQRKSIHCIFAKEPEAEIPQTPKLCQANPEEEVAYQFSIYLQKIIKGRSVQKYFNEMKNNQVNLIKEIRSVHKFSSVIPLFPEEYNEINQHRNVALRQQRKVSKMTQLQADVVRLFRQKEANELGTILDFLEKEYVRLNQEKEIHALHLLAEAERKKREAAEAGKRQREYYRRREHDHFNAHIIKTTQDTSTFYLENVFLEEIENCSKDRAREEIRRYAKLLDKKAQRLIKRDSLISEDLRATSVDEIKLLDEEFIGDVVNTFLFPEVHKRLAFREIALRKQQHLNAAHQILYNKFEEVLPDADAKKSSFREDAYIKKLIKSVQIPDNVISALSCNEDSIRNEALSTIKELYIEISDDNIEEDNYEDEKEEKEEKDENDEIDEREEKEEVHPILSHKIVKKISSKRHVDIDTHVRESSSLIKIIEDVAEKIYSSEDFNENNIEHEDTAITMPDPESIRIPKAGLSSSSSKYHRMTDEMDFPNAYFGE